MMEDNIMSKEKLSYPYPEHFPKNKLLGIMIEPLGKPNDEIVNFISDFTHSDMDMCKYVCNAMDEFKTNYSFYFAKVLEAAFPGGTVCLQYPYKRIVYVHNGEIYDFNGWQDRSDIDYEGTDVIPVWFISSILNDFLNIKSKKSLIELNAENYKTLEFLWMSLRSIIRRYGMELCNITPEEYMIGGACRPTVAINADNACRESLYNFCGTYNDFMKITTNSLNRNSNKVILTKVKKYAYTLAWGEIK